VQFGLCSRLKSHQHFLSVPALITALGTCVNPLSRCTTSIQTKQAGFGHSSKRCWTARSVLPFPSVVDETNWPSQNPLLLKDLYAGIVASEIAAEREDWYNLSDDLIYRAPGVSGDRPKPNEDMSAIEKRPTCHSSTAAGLAKSTTGVINSSIPSSRILLFLPVRKEASA
jgi:hypothetical protein